MIIQGDQEGVTLMVKVVPRSSKNSVAGISGDAFKINLTAPPVDGAANQALIELLAKLCQLPKSNVTILSGETSRLKKVHISGANLAQVKTILGL
jgi:uncharacterized protein